MQLRPTVKKEPKNAKKKRTDCIRNEIAAEICPAPLLLRLRFAFRLRTDLRTVWHKLDSNMHGSDVKMGQDKSAQPLIGGLAGHIPDALWCFYNILHLEDFIAFSVF